MVKSVLGVNHQGLRDWLMQRVTAISWLFILGSIAYFFVMHQGLTYYGLACFIC